MHEWLQSQGRGASSRAFVRCGRLAHEQPRKPCCKSAALSACATAFLASGIRTSGAAPDSCHGAMRSVQGWDSLGNRQTSLPIPPSKKYCRARQELHIKIFLRRRPRTWSSLKAIIGSRWRTIRTGPGRGSSCRQDPVLRRSFLNCQFPRNGFVIRPTGQSVSPRFAMDANALRLAGLRRPQIHSRAFTFLVRVSARPRLRASAAMSASRRRSGVRSKIGPTTVLRWPGLCGSAARNAPCAFWHGSFALHAFLDSPSTRPSA